MSTMTAPPADLTAVREKVKLLADAKRKVAEYRKTVKQWEEYVKGLEAEVGALMGSSTEALVDGRPVLSYEPRDQFAHAKFIADHPDLAIHYMVPSAPSLVLDWRTLLVAEPNIAGAYQTRVMRVLD